MPPILRLHLAVQVKATLPREERLPQVMAVPRGDLLAAASLFLSLQHVACLVEAFKLVLGIWENDMACNICFGYPGVCIFLSYLLTLCVGRARPCVYLTQC